MAEMGQESRALIEAIRHLHGCDSVWVESVPVQELWEGKPVWEGVVDIFNLEGHPTATRACAWFHAQEGTAKRRYVAVLHIPPVDSPVAAVRAAIVAENRRQSDG